MKIRTIGIVLVLAIAFFGVSTIIFSFITNKTLEKIDTQWRETYINSSEQLRLINYLRSEFGYGGMIHDFKNYLLRQDAHRIGKIYQKIGSMNSIIGRYKALSPTTLEQQALMDIQQVILAYDIGLKKAISLIKLDFSTEQIDKTIRVDDSPALNGMYTLEKEAHKRLEELFPNSKGNEKRKTLSLLIEKMGYGGMIHHFKNYVLRKEKQNLVKIKGYLNDLKKIILKYRELKVSNEEIEALNGIEDVINAYFSKLKALQTFAESGKNSLEIDNLVRVNDNPAITGISTLIRSITLQNSKSMAHVGKLIGHIKSLALTILVIGIFLTISLIILSFWGVFNRVISPLLKISSVTNLIGKGNISIRVPLQDRTDEFGELAKSIQIFKCNSIELEKSIQDVEATTQAKSTFLANMSHELRTPLNAIIGYSDMLCEDIEDMSAEHIKGDLKNINRSGMHLLGLIQDILDLSKIEAGKMELHPTQFNVEEMIQTLKVISTPLSQKNNNELLFLNKKNVGDIVCDEGKIKQSLLNLLSNACKFTNGGKVTLDYYVEKELKEKPPYLIFSVSDTGCGISRSKQGKLFSAFSQADAGTTREYGGTGLGLVITKQFCKLMRGDVSMSSVAGEGSAFKMKIPFEVSVSKGIASTKSK